MAHQNYSPEIADVILSFLDGLVLGYTFSDETGVFKFALTMDPPPNLLRFHVHVRAEDFLTYAIFPLSLDVANDDKRIAMTEFLCRVNYGLPYGNFELDLEDGTLRYKVTVDCDGREPTSDLFLDSIVLSVSTFQRFSPGILAIYFSDDTGEEAFARCETPD